jgi:hypothetical protein
MHKLRIVTVGISGGRSLTGPLRDARRFPSTRLYPVPGATRTPRGPSFKDHILSPQLYVLVVVGAQCGGTRVRLELREAAAAVALFPGQVVAAEVS